MDTWNTKARMSRSERNGTIVLLLLLLALTLFKRPLCMRLAGDAKKVKPVAYHDLLARINAAKLLQKENPGYAQSFTGSANYAKTNKKGTLVVPLEINSATAADLETLYGIGPVLAGRIVKFREGLGGFQRIEQLRDVYGIKPEVFEQISPKLRIQPKPPRRLNINEADAETLSAHPYIPPTLAKQFVGYRNKVKPFDNVEEIRNLYYLRDHPDLYDKLSPYLTVN